MKQSLDTVTYKLIALIPMVEKYFLNSVPYTGKNPLLVVRTDKDSYRHLSRTSVKSCLLYYVHGRLYGCSVWVLYSVSKYRRGERPRLIAGTCNRFSVDIRTAGAAWRSTVIMTAGAMYLSSQIFRNISLFFTTFLKFEVTFLRFHFPFLSYVTRFNRLRYEKVLFVKVRIWKLFKSGIKFSFRFYNKSNYAIELQTEWYKFYIASLLRGAWELGARPCPDFRLAHFYLLFELRPNWTRFDWWRVHQNRLTR